MIGKLSGRMEYRGDDHVLIDVGGVGYIVHVSQRTLAALPGPGEAVSLYTALLVREDLLQLFGFATLVEKEWHKLLMSVQGIGARASMAILSALGPDGVSRAIALGDWNAVKAAQGVGPKIAQRVVNELKDKAPAVMAMGGAPAAGAPGGTAGGTAGGTVPPAAGQDRREDEVIEAAAPPAGGGTGGDTGGGTGGGAQAEALSALRNLGYAPGDAAAAVARAAGETPGADTPDLIRAALRLLAPKG